MKLGFSELLLILIIIGAVLLTVRGIPFRREREEPPPPPRPRRLTAAEMEAEHVRSARRKRLRWLGGGFILIGLLVLAGTFNLFKFILSWYAGAAIIIISGVTVLVLSLRR